MKRLLIYELASISFLALTLYLVPGDFTGRDIEILGMYSIFMLGTLGYVFPIFKRRDRDRK